MAALANVPRARATIGVSERLILRRIGAVRKERIGRGSDLGEFLMV
jgi:hypothetical protein